MNPCCGLSVALLSLPSMGTAKCLKGFIGHSTSLPALDAEEGTKSGHPAAGHAVASSELTCSPDDRVTTIGSARSCAAILAIITASSLDGESATVRKTPAMPPPSISIFEYKIWLWAIPSLVSEPRAASVNAFASFAASVNDAGVTSENTILKIMRRSEPASAPPSSVLGAKVDVDDEDCEDVADAIVAFLTEPRVVGIVVDFADVADVVGVTDDDDDDDDVELGTFRVISIGSGDEDVELEDELEVEPEDEVDLKELEDVDKELEDVVAGEEEEEDAGRLWNVRVVDDSVVVVVVVVYNTSGSYISVLGSADEELLELIE